MSDYGIEQAPAGPTAAGPGREADEEYRQQRSPYAADLDVAIIGGGIAGLATAVALRRLNSDWQIKVRRTLEPACSRSARLHYLSAACPMCLCALGCCSGWSTSCRMEQHAVRDYFPMQLAERPAAVTAGPPTTHANTVTLKAHVSIACFPSAASKHRQGSGSGSNRPVS